MQVTDYSFVTLSTWKHFSHTDDHLHALYSKERVRISKSMTARRLWLYFDQYCIGTMLHVSPAYLLHCLKQFGMHAKGSNLAAKAQCGYWYNELSGSNLPELVSTICNGMKQFLPKSEPWHACQTVRFRSGLNPCR